MYQGPTSLCILSISSDSLFETPTLYCELPVLLSSSTRSKSFILDQKRNQSPWLSKFIGLYVFACLLDSYWVGKVRLQFTRRANGHHRGSESSSWRNYLWDFTPATTANMG